MPDSASQTLLNTGRVRAAGYAALTVCALAGMLAAAYVQLPWRAFTILALCAVWLGIASLFSP